MKTIKRKKESKKERVVTEAYLDMRLEGFKKEITEGYLDMHLDGLKEEMRGETAKILQAVDGVMTRFDGAEKEEAAHTLLHRRIADTVHEHDQRIGRLEVVVKI